ncbi:hypothetical protein XaC1_186 [Xanthomonas phage XaC1]|nr:hypothetical protein XaC1_186 [Xanthomonas phage XaC1]
MVFTKEQIIEVSKVLKFGEADCGVFSQDDIDTLYKHRDYISEQYNNHIADSENEQLKLNFRNAYLSTYNFYSTHNPCYYVALVRCLTLVNVAITYKVVPEFRNHVEMHRNLLIVSRLVKFDENKAITNEDEITDIVKPNNALIDFSSVLEVIKFSKELGNKGTSPKREQSAVQAKLIEEVGEHSVEIQIQNGITYKDAGVDGIAGEAVDIAICAIDSFALEYPDKSPEEIFGMFQTYMSTKLAKWKRTV